MQSHGLKVKVCQADVMNSVIPEALVRSPLKSYLTQERRREELPQIALISHQKGDASEVLGVYGLQAMPPKRLVDMLDFLQSTTKLSDREKVKKTIKDEIKKTHDFEVEQMAH